MKNNRKTKKRKKRAQKRKSIVILLIICGVIAAAIAVLSVRMAQKSSAPEAEKPQSTSQSVTEETTAAVSPEAEPTQTPAPTPTATPKPTPKPAVVLPPETIASAYGYMIRLSDRSVVLEKSRDEIIYPASMTKIMTALVAAEQLSDLSEPLQIRAEVTGPLYEIGASMAGFTEGEWVTAYDLLCGTLLPSGAEAAVTLAERVAGSEEAFAGLMNQKAAELGMVNTHFTNCTGLHDGDLYTTCTDMEKLLEAAIANPTVFQIMTMQDYTCAPNEYHEEGLYLSSTLFAYLDSPVLENGAQILGGKTGTTDEAGYCLASFGAYEGDLYLLVTAYGPFGEENVHSNVTDAVAAYGALR